MKRFFRSWVLIGAVLGLTIAAIAPSTLAANPAKGRFASRRIDVSGASPRVERLHANRSGTVGVIVRLTGDTLSGRIARASAGGTSLTKPQRRKVVEQIEAAQRDTVRRAERLGTVRWTYQTVLNGFAMRISRGRLPQLATLPGVAGIQPVHKVELDNERSVPFIGAPSVWQDLGKTGAGVKIGIIDTGIDYYHANLGGSGDPQDYEDADGLGSDNVFPTAKVAGGYDFVGDDYDYDTVPEPDADPLDCQGHGSHVAGTAAGNGVLSTDTAYPGPYDDSTIGNNTWNIGPGVAPEATLYAYRAFGCDGATAEDIVIAAIDQAVLDGVDVINMSLSSEFGPRDDYSAIAADNASAAGVTVVAAASNDGPGAYLTGSPGTATSAISVAAMDGGFPGTSSVSIDLEEIGAMANNNGGGDLPITADLEVLQDGDRIALGCDPGDYSGAAGKIVVTRRGICPRVDRAIFGQEAGALAVIMVNNQAGLPLFEGPIPGVTIPFLGAAGDPDDELSALEAAFIDAHGTSRTLTDAGLIPSATYLHLANFSSGGPRTGDSAIKPDVTAPGVGTFSTLVGSGTGRRATSGTSMASPHVAGVAALVTQEHPSWTPERIKAAIMNTATVDPSVLASASDRNVRLAGAGAVQARKAVGTKLLATTGPGESSLSFGARAIARIHRASRKITFWNTGGSPVTLNLTSSFQSTAGVPVKAKLSKTQVKVPAGGSKRVTFKLALTKSTVANLPEATASTVGELVTIRGAVLATPATGGAGIYQLRVPFLLAPRGLSKITTGKKLAFGDASVKNLKLKNKGVHGGAGDIYAWGNSSPKIGIGAEDLRADGVKSLPGDVLGGDESDRSLFFAINTYEPWNSPSEYEFDVFIDTNMNGTVEPSDRWIVGFDEGYMLDDFPNGSYAAFIFDGDFEDVIGARYADAPMNGSTMLLPALASEDLGLSPGSPSFQYQVSSYELWTDEEDADTTFSAFNAFSAPVSTGDAVNVAPRAIVYAPLSINRAQLAGHPQQGWMVVSLDNAVGSKQATLVKLTYKP